MINGDLFKEAFAKKLKKRKINFEIKQSNISINTNKYTLRGFHYLRKPYKENKIMLLMNGSTYNVIIDLRTNSKNHLKSTSLNYQIITRFNYSKWLCKRIFNFTREHDNPLLHG